MNLTIKDLSSSIELDRAGMSAVRGGAQGNTEVNTIGQGQIVNVPVATLAGGGSSQNTDVDVDASQYASIYTRQNNGDAFKFLVGLPVIL